MVEQVATADEPGDGHGPGRRGVVRFLQDEAAPSAPRMLLGTALCRRRMTLNLTQGEVARRLGWSNSKVSRLEGGHHRFKQQDVQHLFTVYQVQDQQERQRLEQLAELANEPTWWHPWSAVAQQYVQAAVSFEDMAQRIKSYDDVYLHGLLQTPEYARALIEQGRGSSSTHDALAKLREERQSKFETAPNKMLICVISEGALRNGVGSPAIMRRQIERLIHLSSNPRFQIRLLEQGLFGIPVHLGATTIFDFGGRVPKIPFKEDYEGALIIQDEAMVDRMEKAFDKLRWASLRPEATRRKLNHYLSSPHFYR